MVMQPISEELYKKIVERGGFETLFVLTIGIGIALVIDFFLKISRAFILDRESGDIDVELSEFFFARLLGVGLDARPPSVGTLAAQLKGLDSIRGLMTSASFLILADLPFALLFIERQNEKRLVVSSKPSSEIRCASESFFVEEELPRELFFAEELCCEGLSGMMRVA